MKKERHFHEETLNNHQNNSEPQLEQIIRKPHT